VNRLLPTAVLALALAAGTVSLALADDVYLANGQVFEDVIAQRSGEQVRIRMAHGEMGVPASWVVRIEESETALGRYLRRKAALGEDASARDWLELARWARSEGFAEGAREAALSAAALDPRLDGLEPLLRSAGFVFDDESGSWLTEEALMVRRGYVRVGGEWLPAQVVAERARAADEARAAAAQSAREARLDQVITLLALSQLEEAREDRAREAVPVAYPYGAPAVGAPVAVFPGTFFPPAPRAPQPRPPHRHGPPPATSPDAHHSGFTYDALAGRQPGSIIPLALDPGAARGREN
jgi:hypothetical protein